MSKSLPLTCPSCSTRLKVKNLQCDKCGTSVEGLFDLPSLVSLPADDQLFVLHFIKYSGSLKEMAKHLNLSYPTVRNILDEIIGRITKIEKTLSK